MVSLTSPNHCMVIDIVIACHKVVGRHQWDIPLSALMNGDGLLQVGFLAPVLFPSNYSFSL